MAELAVVAEKARRPQALVSDVRALPTKFRHAGRKARLALVFSGLRFLSPTVWRYLSSSFHFLVTGRLHKMLVLYETALGFCLFKLTDEGKLESDDVYKDFETPEKASKL